LNAKAGAILCAELEHGHICDWIFMLLFLNIPWKKRLCFEKHVLKLA